ncbi:hypothetical protein SSBR45G_38440 [Bradyrhizobium sp. SSBR45G]|nr:hypothetical protein SSBR45G_38440 [Bradyrhizobium sp. SSBR45G]GLH85258.1 hypothetical protein SSBR45R_27180 [Bradyrhizobium sp. SSBR45R]
MRAACVDVVVPEDADIAAGDDRADGEIALERPFPVTEQLRVGLALRGGVSGVLVDPLLAVGEAIGRQRRISLDLRVERDAGLDCLVDDASVGLGLGGEGGRNSEQAQQGGVWKSSWQSKSRVWKCVSLGGAQVHDRKRIGARSMTARRQRLFDD